MLEQLAYEFLIFHNETEANGLVQASRLSGFHHLGMLLGRFFEKQFPHSITIKDEYAINTYYSKQYEKAYNIFHRLLNMKSLSENIANRAIFNQHFSIDHVANRYNFYNKELINNILKRNHSQFPLVTFTMTSCKRFDLFQQTVNSFLNSCLDVNKIDTWLCIDDNSSEEDREKMKLKFLLIHLVGTLFRSNKIG